MSESVPPLTEQNFDGVYYLARNPDVAQFYGQAPEAAWVHWDQFGRNEGRLARGLDWPAGVTTLQMKQVQPEPVPHAFTCNICGAEVSAWSHEVRHREFPSCPNCHSSLRMRSVIQALSMELFGKTLCLPDFPQDKSISGIGMSDWTGYAVPLAEKLDYTNTFYHQEPRLDIVNIDPADEGRYDFIISTDVFEHIPPPISTAFINTFKLLKPGGVLVFTVPYTKEGETIEHFPELYQFELKNDAGKPQLFNRTRDGREQVFDDLVFHGGDGFTLEMRMFSEMSLYRELREAGFEGVKIYDMDKPEHGIIWPINVALPIAAKKPG